jgi:hypothetical protein
VVNKDQLRESDILSLIRFAKYLGLRKDLDTMSKKSLVKLIAWKLRKEAPFEVKSGWSW